VSSDIELLEGWASGDRDAGDALIERHFEAVYRFFRNKFNEEVHDLVQDTFLRCMEAIDTYRGHSSFRAFLFGVARRVLYDALRAKYRDREDIDLDEVSAADLGPSPSQLVARQQEHRLLLEALRMIPLDHQLALELVYWEQLTGAELGEVLEVNGNTARTRLRRARTALAERLEALCASPEQLQSTLDNLDRWALAVRELIHPPA
jgi:RNA polymerase sigma-70 factor (ECF subfamily)